MSPNIPLLTTTYGFRVFPIRHKSKRPAIKGWPERASSDLDSCRVLWHDAEIGPGDFNAGVVTDGLCVVDIDSMPEGWKDLDPKTFKVRTGKGWHWYFTTDLSISPAPLYPGEVDIKSGPGAMVLAPGSTHPSGAVYEIVDDRKPQPLPSWVLHAIRDAGLLKGAVRSPGTLAVPGPEDEATEDNPLLLDAIRSQLALVGGRGERNRSLFNFACNVYRDFGNGFITRATTDGLLVEACHLVLADDFDSAECERTINSAWKSVFGADA